MLVHPKQRRASRGLETSHQFYVAGPALELIEENQKQRRCVVAAVVGGMRDLPQSGELPVANFVKDLPRLGITKVVIFLRLGRRQHLERCVGESQLKGQRLVSGDETVASEQSHEPGQPGGGQRPCELGARAEAKRGKIYQALLIGVCENVPLPLHPRRVLQPLLQSQRNLGLQTKSRRASRLWPPHLVANETRDVYAEVPARPRAEHDIKSCSAISDLTL